jgi:hypothetical protein
LQCFISQCRAKWLNKPITLLYNNWLVLADNPLLIYRSFHDNTFATAETQNITLKCFKRCPASFALKCPKRGYALVADDPITNISASQPHERCKLRPISNQVTNNFQQSFPNLRKSSKFLRSDSDGGEPAKKFAIAGVFRTPKRISKSSIHHSGWQNIQSIQQTFQQTFLGAFRMSWP